MAEILIPKSELIDPKKLKRNPKNVKQHSEEQIAGLMELMKLVGFISVIVIDKKNMIWAGDARVQAALLLEMNLVPCVRLEHLTKKQLNALMIMDNKINESPWNTENLSEVLQELEDFDFSKFNLEFDDIEDENYKPDSAVSDDLDDSPENFKILFNFALISDYELVLQKLKEIHENKEIALLQLLGKK